jgi:hypothetical protein
MHQQDCGSGSAYPNPEPDVTDIYEVELKSLKHPIIITLASTPSALYRQAVDRRCIPHWRALSPWIATRATGGA